MAEGAFGWLEEILRCYEATGELSESYKSWGNYAGARAAMAELRKL